MGSATTDEQLERLSNTINAEAAEQHLVLRDTIEGLTDQRQNLRDAREDNDD